MPYELLTGATGLLGNYLLRDLLLAGRHVAVVVRPSRIDTARQRVENVLAYWESELGRVLPRPPVLEGDICRPGLGLDAAAARWVADNCHAVIHNAASLAFEPNEQTGEPHRSNVEGTRNVLELCRWCGIRQFHHVSTAYVCGLRTGRVFEDELDVGQQLGNVYEQTKVRAEKLVREAAFLDPPTVYRPAIIIGDSATGYSTTFHGFYVPLKILHAMADHIDDQQFTQWLPVLSAFNMTGDERKNYVPVDWVARAITAIVRQPAQHGRTYHLTPSRPVGLTAMCEVIEEALRETVHHKGSSTKFTPALEEVVQTLVSQLDSYRAYWRDDPEFDATNTSRVLPHLPCPEVDRDMLYRTARYALTTNFGWPRSPSLRPKFDVHGHLGRQFPLGFENGHDHRSVELFGMQVNGPGGGQWTLVVENGRPLRAQHGLSGRWAALLNLNSRTFERLSRSELSVEQAHQRGQLAVESSGPAGAGARALTALQALASGNAGT